MTSWRAIALASAPYLIILLLWLGLYPGIFSDDSLGYWLYASTGQFYADGPASWLAWLWLTSIGGRIPGLSTLAGALTLITCIDYWLRSFRWRFRPWLLVAASLMPTVWAVGLTLWKDVPLTAGLFLAAGLVTRALRSQARLTWQAAALCAASGLLISMKANGPATALVAVPFVALLALPSTRRRVAIVSACCAAVAVLALYIPQAALTSSPGAKTGIEYSGLIADVGCAIQTSGIALTSEQEAELASRFGLHSDWWRSEVCMWTDALYRDPGFAGRVRAVGPVGIVETWAPIAMAHPLEITQARAIRLNNQLPWPMTGLPKPLPFIQSVITPNEMGIDWATPGAADVLRVPMRAWNAARLLTGSPGLWLLVGLILGAVTWRSWRRQLLPTVAYMTVLQGLLFLFSPFSESRYGLLTLIAGPLMLASWTWQTIITSQLRTKSESGITMP